MVNSARLRGVLMHRPRLPWLLTLVCLNTLAGTLVTAAQASSAATETPGAQRWLTRHDDSAHKNDEANALGVSPDGTKVLVAGSVPGSNGYDDYLTISYNTATGAAVWTRHYNGPANRTDDASAIVVSPDRSKVFVTGRAASSSGWDYGTVAYDLSTGAPLWVRRYNGAGNGNDA